MHFVAKIWGVYSCGQDAILTLGRIPVWGQARGGGSPSLEAFKPQIDKDKATLTMY